MQEYINSLYQGTQTTKDGRVSGRGFGAFLLNPLVDENKLNQDAQQTLNQQTAIGLGEDLSELNVGPNASALDVQGAAIRQTRDRESDRRDEDHRRSTEIPLEQLRQQSNALQASNELSRDQLAATTKAAENQYNLALKQGNDNYSLALLQMQDNASQRMAELEYQKSRDRKEDMRYNERIEELDRKDRRQAMQSLAAGLASLGAAFAL